MQEQCLISEGGYPGFNEPQIPSGKIINVGPLAKPKRSKSRKKKKAKQQFHPAQTRSYKIPLLLFITCAALTVAIGYLIANTDQEELTAFLDEKLSSFRVSVSSSHAKERFLYRMSKEKERKTAGEVHYVSEIIRKNRRRPEEAKELALSIVERSSIANYDPIFVSAVIKSESAFKNNARSPVGARGLMQIMPATGRYVSNKHELPWQGTSKLHEAEYNLDLGIAYLKELEERYDGNREYALMAYNWGPGNLERALKHRTRIPSQVRTYAKTILRNHKKWTFEFNSKKNQYQYLNLELLRKTQI